MRSRTRLLCLHAILTLSGVHVANIEAQAHMWTATDFPNPRTPDGAKACSHGRFEGLLCDPDEVLTPSGAVKVVHLLKEIERGEGPYIKNNCTQPGPIPGFQIGVALAEKLVSPNSWVPGESTTKSSGRYFYNTWKLGTPGCNNSLLMFFDQQAWEVWVFHPFRNGQLPQDQVLGIINRMNPALTHRNFDRAIEDAVADLGLALAGKPLRTPPSYRDINVSQAFALVKLGFGAICIVILLFMLPASLAGLAYRKIGLAMQEEWKNTLETGIWPAKSCPICFCSLSEGLEGHKILSDSGESSPNEDTQFWEQSHEQEADPNQPLISGENERLPLDVENPGTSKSKPWSKGKLRPPFFLSCGHTFCKDCISKVLENTMACPICDQGVQNCDMQPDGQLRLSMQSQRSLEETREKFDRENQFRITSLNRKPSCKFLEKYCLVKHIGRVENFGDIMSLTKTQRVIQLNLCYLENLFTYIQRKRRNR